MSTVISGSALSTSTSPLILGPSFDVQCAVDSTFKYERLDKNNAVLLVVDHQIGLFQMVRDYQPEQFRNSIFAHAAIGKVFNLPTILTTSAETGTSSHFSHNLNVLDANTTTGPNGPLPKEIIAMHPNAPLIKRNGEVDAWDNQEFRDAVKATGKKQVIIGGITTDVRPSSFQN